MDARRHDEKEEEVNRATPQLPWAGGLTPNKKAEINQDV